MSRSALLLFFAVLILTVPVALGQTDKPVPDHEGPYVYWHDSDKATVFYLCQGQLNQQTFEDFDTLRFHRFCEAEAREHTIVGSTTLVQPDQFDSVSRIFAVSDIHGEYDALVDLLEVASVVDTNLDWAWGDGHLVINGDIFDRGRLVTEVLWLIYRLEGQALRAGGRVHYLLGNHEMMVLAGDNRYVHEKYLQGIARKSRINHQDLYGPDMELGRWLRSKHVLLRLNDILFVHAGVSPDLVQRGYSLTETNARFRAALQLSSSQLAFSEDPKFLRGGLGPLWYRGMMVDMGERYTQLTEGQISEILEAYDVEVVIVGHSEMDQVDSYYNGQVIGLDVPVEELNSLQGMLWTGGSFYRIDGAGRNWLLRSATEN